MEPSVQNPPRAILIATDLTARCDRALARAQLLAETWQARLVVVHALTQGAARRVLDEPPPAADNLEEARQRIRRELMPSLADSAIVVERGKPADVIARAATAQACDLIITGIGSDDTLSRMGLPRTTGHLVRRLGVPLLRVREKAEAPYRSILVGVDMTQASRRALQAAATLFPGRPLGVVHAYEPPLPGSVVHDAQQREERRRAALRDCSRFLSSGMGEGHPFQLYVGDGWPNSVIQQHVQDHDIDLVVLGAHDHGAIFDLLFGSTAVEALGSLSCDVLIVGRRGGANRQVRTAA